MCVCDAHSKHVVTGMPGHNSLCNDVGGVQVVCICDAHSSEQVHVTRVPL